MSGFKPKNNNIININSSRTKTGNFKLKAKGSYNHISYYKTQNDFYDNRAYISYIKSIEKIVRNSDEYKTYINYLKTEIGLDYCAIWGKVTDDKVSIEMHHGPIFTLFDIVSIVLEHCLLHKEKVSTFKIAKLVLQEHYENNIQVVMLCKTAHDSVHAGKAFISSKQAWGNINKFIEKYGDGMTRDQIETYNKIVEIEEKNNHTTDNGNFKIDKIRSWSDDNNDLDDSIFDDYEEELELIELEEDDE